MPVTDLGTPPAIELTHLDNLWIQVSGTLCNLSCTHCFNRSGPTVRTFDLMTPEAVRGAIDAAVGQGVREIFFTGGEPFLHPRLLDMLGWSLDVAPTTVLTNGMAISDRVADQLAALEQRSRYSFEIRVSLDGHTETMNDRIRGRGVFRQVLAAIARLSQRGLLPLVTMVRTWPDADESAVLAGFAQALRDAGDARARLKILPALPLGRELERTPNLSPSGLVSAAMLDGFDRDLLMCSNSRVVTDRGVWVCPLLVEAPDARLGATLDEAATRYPLRHAACVSCWHYGTICGNINAGIDGPDLAHAAPAADSRP